ncbi:MAG: two-component system response regulator NreC [Algoriphagus sp.]|jgi:two-component system response regulator NreC
MIKIAIVDDHHLFRAGLSSMFSKSNIIEVVGSFADGEAYLDFLGHYERVDIVLLDISMPLIDGLDILDICKKKYPNIKSIILSMHNDGNYIVQSVKKGAMGYLLKNVEQKELTQAIENVYQGKKYFNKETTDLMLINMAVETEDIKKLSEREQEILAHIADGLTTKEMAQKLILSTRTIETHRVNMMKKLNVKNSAELIKKALELKIL